MKKITETQKTHLNTFSTLVRVLIRVLCVISLCPLWLKNYKALSATTGLRKNFWRFTILFVLFSVFFFQNAIAHVIPYDLTKLSQADVGWIYLKLGYTHILPNGFDHILFVLGIFFLNPKLKPVIWQATAFTVAHSITLGLAMYGIIKPVSSIVEPVIALSIVFVAVENILSMRLNWWRIVIVFCFGLIHGCGFASALSELGLPPDDYLLSLISFNIGVELGQISVILLAFILVGKWFGEKIWYRQRIVMPVSFMIGAIAMYWTIERIFF